MQRLANKMQPADLSSLLIRFFLLDPRATLITRRAWCSASQTRSNLWIFPRCLSVFFFQTPGRPGFIVFAYQGFLLDPRVTWITRRAWCSASPTRCGACRARSWTPPSSTPGTRTSTTTTTGPRALPQQMPLLRRRRHPLPIKSKSHEFYIIGFQSL